MIWKKGNVVLFGLLVLLLSCNADNDIGIADTAEGFEGELVWVKSFGGSGDETAESVIETVDGGYAVLGFTDSTDGDLEGKVLPVNDYWLLSWMQKAILNGAIPMGAVRTTGDNRLSRLLMAVLPLPDMP